MTETNEGQSSQKEQITNPVEKADQEATTEEPRRENTKEAIMALVDTPEGQDPPISNKELARTMRKIAIIAPPGHNPNYWRDALSELLKLDLPDTEEAQEELAIAAGVIHEALEASQKARDVQDGATMKEAIQQDTVSYGVFVNAEFTQEEMMPQVSIFPPEWFKKMSPEGQQVIRARIRMAKAAAEKRKFCDFDPEKTMRNEHLRLTQKEFMLLYEVPGVRWALENYMQSLFTLDDQKKIRLKPYDGGIEQVVKSLGAFQNVQEKMIKFIMDEKIDEINNETDARAAVAIAWNFLFIGNVVESADVNRDTDPVGGVCGEAVRTMMHPMVKAKAKYGIKKITQAEKKEKKQGEEKLKVGTEEGWGGGIGIWIASRVSKDSKIVRALSSGGIRPFPETLFASFPELITVDTHRGPMSMAKALMKGEEITCGKTDEDLFGRYANTWDSAFKVYRHAMGEVPLDMKQTTPEIWGSALADAMGKLRENPLLKSACDREAILWIIVNSLGGPNIHSPEPILSLPAITYSAIINRIVCEPRLVPKKEDRDWIKEKLIAQGVTSIFSRASLLIRSAMEASKTNNE